MACPHTHNYAISALEGDDWALVYAGADFDEAVDALVRILGEALAIADHGPTVNEISTCMDEHLRLVAAVHEIEDRPAREPGRVYRDENDDCLECDCAHQMPRDPNDPGAYPGPDPDCDCECGH